MPVDVIAFPPVGAVGSMWTARAPVMVSRSMRPDSFNKRYVSRIGRERREAMVNVSALARTRSGAGYSEMLARFLDGGANLVRLSSYPINWHLDAARDKGLLSSTEIEWLNSGDPLAWTTGGQPLLWFDGTVLSGVVSGNEITVSGLPANMLVARPGDFLRAFVDLTGSDGDVSQVVTEARSDASGVAVIRLFDDLADGTYARVNLGDSDSRVFEAVELPRSHQPLGANWFFEWNFREVFADEVGGFNELDPW